MVVTNLIEKSLLLGFSIFLLTIFSSILIPFLNVIHDFNKSDKPDLDSYQDFFDEMDLAVGFVINNPTKFYQNDIYYPKDLNTTIFNCFIVFEFQFRDDNFSHVLVYNVSFVNCYFHNFPPQVYLLNVSYASSYILIDFLKQN
ncbi:MAG: hypothetical protein ACFE8B_11235 [Candidatus Hermodarchaeota archaeon]